MLVWFFIGYCFATRYLHMGISGGIIGGMLMSFIILQVERIIILSHHISWGGKAFRILLAMVMAILGALIMDQFTFKDDIELRRVQVLDVRVKDAIQISEQDIRKQVAEIDSMISEASVRYDEVVEEISKRPCLTVPLTQTTYTVDSMGIRTAQTTSVRNEMMPNPKSSELPKLEGQIKDLRDRRFETLDRINTLAETKKKELESATGFLNELNLLKEVIASSWVGMFVYALFLFFFLALELFILVMKLSDKKSDYEKLIDHQVEVNIQRIDMLRA